jgi:hypothetical protein
LRTDEDQGKSNLHTKKRGGEEGWVERTKLSKVVTLTPLVLLFEIHMRAIDNDPVLALREDLCVSSSSQEEDGSHRRIRLPNTVSRQVTQRGEVVKS